MRHRAAVAVILLLCACADVVLVPVDDPGPSMNISVFATQSVSEGMYSLAAYLDPGSDPSAMDPAVVGSAALVVNDTVLIPEQQRTSSERVLLRYAWERKRDATQPTIDTLRLELPRWAGRPASTVKVEIPIPSRADPADVDVSQGVLRLHVAEFTPDSTAVRRQNAFWILQLRSQCTGGAPAAVSVQGNAQSPSEIIVPREWFAALSDSAMACLTTFSTYVVRGAAFPTFIGMSTLIQWRVRIP